MFRELRFEPLEDRRLLAVSPAGPEFRVHTTTAGTQEAAAIAADADGDFVVVWHSFDSDTLHDVFAQRFNADGVLQGAEFQVNAASPDIQSNPDVAMDADGDFVVVWNSDDEGGGGYEVYARRFNAAGNPLGDELQVNSTSLRDQDQPAVAMAPDGQFVVVWRSLELDGSLVGVIFGQLYDASGNAVGGEFRIDGPAFEFSSNPDVAMDDGGGFTVVWGSDTDAAFEIQGRRYVGGAALGAEFQIDEGLGFLAGGPAVASDSSGRFVVAWSASTPFDVVGVAARRFDESGGALGGEFLVNTTVAGAQITPGIAIAADGGFVIVWASDEQDDSGIGVFAQQYDALGSPIGEESQVNTETIGQQRLPAVAMDHDGDFIVAWDSETQDPGGGVYAQRFAEDLVCIEELGQFAVPSGQSFLMDRDPVVAADADGDTVIVWERSGFEEILARRFDDRGCPKGPEFQVGSLTGISRFDPQVAMDADGNLVVVWAADAPEPGFQVFIQAQRFDANGIGIGGEFQVQESMDHQLEPSIAMSTDGSFIVVWTELEDSANPEARILAQRFTSTGLSLGEEILVTDFVLPPPFGFRIDVAMDVAGRFVIVWESDQAAAGVTAQAYLDTGLPNGPRLQVTSSGVQQEPAVAMDRDGEFVVVWDDEGQGIVGQRYTVDAERAGPVFNVSTPFVDPPSSAEVNMDASGGFVVVWENGGHILARNFDNAGEPRAAQRMVNLDSFNEYEWPSVAVSNDGDTLVTWRNIFGKLSARRLAPPGEFPANSTTAADQLFPAAAATDDGRTVVVWHGDAQDGDALGVFGQRYNADGLAAGQELAINTTTAGFQSVPSAAMDAEGEFVVVWQSSIGDGDGLGIFGQRFLSSGARRDFEFRVNSTTAGEQMFPDVASDAEGAFVVVWQSLGQDGSSFGVYGQRFDRNGFPVDGEFRANTITLGAQGEPAVASDADGDIVVVWQSDGTDGDSYGIYGQRYTRDGVPQGGEFLVNTVTAGDQTYPDVALDDEGNFVVVWHSIGQDGDAGGIFARLFDSTGLALGHAFAVNQATAGDQSAPTVSRNADGGFVISWTSQGQDGDGLGVFGRAFDAMGVPTSGEFRINETTAGNQGAASVAVDGDGDLLVAWQSDEQDGSGYGIFARRLAAASLPPPPPPPPPVLLTRSTAGFYDAANGAFFLRNANDTGVADLTFNYGASGAGLVAAVGDWNGDDIDTVGLYAPDTGAFFLRNANSAGPADVTYVLGPGGLVLRPLVGDWNGDGIDTAGLYDPNTGAFFIRNVHAAGPADLTFNYGAARAGLVPLAGDWDGDGDDTIGLYNRSTGVFFLKNANTAGAADLTINFGPGGADITPVAGDWDADGDGTPGIYNKPTSVFFLRNEHAGGAADVTFNFGPNASGWQPLVGDFNGPSATGLRLASLTSARSDRPAVTEAAARPLLDEARARWAAAGINLNDARRAGGVSPLFPLPPLSPHSTVRIADLPGDLLGLAEGNAIVIDHNAAGRGWFIDPTPARDEEFQSTNGRLIAVDLIFASEAVDLLTVIAHELGHLLGLDHAQDGVMAETLALGERKVPIE